MKKPVLISSLIHAVIFGGLTLAVIISPKPVTYTENPATISGIELNSPHSNGRQAVTAKTFSKSEGQEMSKKGEEITQNQSSSSGTSQVSESQNLQNQYFFEIQKKIQAEERYPKEAKKRGIEETVIVQFALNDQGGITTISLFSKPNSHILAEAALSAVKAAAPFSAPPAGISKEFRIPIEFKIK